MLSLAVGRHAPPPLPRPRGSRAGAPWGGRPAPCSARGGPAEKQWPNQPAADPLAQPEALPTENRLRRTLPEREEEPLRRRWRSSRPNLGY
eukprot:2988514-Pyramimonas_sp.AAC.1